jgi:ribosomal protein S18 acetylase RimI-like enzyme
MADLGPEVSFRRYAPGDIPVCARLAREAWPANEDVAQGHSEQTGMEGYMEYSLSASNYTDIATTPEGMAGFLFGRIDGYPGRPVQRRSMLGELPSIVRSSLEHGPTMKSMLGFLWSLGLTDLKLMLRMPKSDAAIEMLIVDSRHRERGIGTELMDRFLRTAADSGARLVTLYTDDRMSNWQFYERKGFRRVGTFYDNITSHYSGAHTRGIIYALDLPEKT